MSTYTTAKSTDGINWTGVAGNTGNGILLNRVNFVKHINDTWFVGGDGSSVYSTDINDLAYSNDGETWVGLGNFISGEPECMAVKPKTTYSNITFDNSGNPSVYLHHPTLAFGSGNHTIYYSEIGKSFVGLGRSIFSEKGNGGFWNGDYWIGVGKGTNTIAHSIDGIEWTGLGQSIFSVQGMGVSFDGTNMLAVGEGTNTIAYSNALNKENWTGLGTSIFSTKGNNIAYNGTIFVAVGEGTNTIAYSIDGLTWTGIGTSIFSTRGNGITWTGTKWIATGSGTNTLACSSNGVDWTGLGETVFSTEGFNVDSNTNIIVAVGQGTNSIAYSENDGLNWTGLGLTQILSYGKSVCFNGKYWILSGNDPNVFYSLDGKTWRENSTLYCYNYIVGNNPTKPLNIPGQITIDNRSGENLSNILKIHSTNSDYSLHIEAETY